MLRAATGRSRPAETAVANDAGADMRSAPSIVSASTEVHGGITTSDELHIHGKVNGDIRAAAITICASGKVIGDLTADTIVIDGAAEGRIEAQHVVLRAGADVKGAIQHGSLGIDTAANFEGTIKRVGPAAPAAVAAE
jgi:cytoskeletal protein CcmA (bactofilin family)